MGKAIMSAAQDIASLPIQNSLCGVHTVTRLWGQASTSVSG